MPVLISMGIETRRLMIGRSAQAQALAELQPERGALVRKAEVRGGGPHAAHHVGGHAWADSSIARSNQSRHCR
jgi:hypothetical protein